MESAVVVIIVEINLSLVVVYSVIERLIILLRNYRCRIVIFGISCHRAEEIIKAVERVIVAET